MCLGFIAFDIYNEPEYKVSIGDVLFLSFVTFVPIVNTGALMTLVLVPLGKLISKFDFGKVIWSKAKK